MLLRNINVTKSKLKKTKKNKKIQEKALKNIEKTI